MFGEMIGAGLVGLIALVPLLIGIILILVVLIRLGRIADATEVAAQSLAMINRKLNAVTEQVVPKENQQIFNAQYDARVQPSPRRMR